MIDLYIDLWPAFISMVNNYQGGWFRPQSDFEKQVNKISLEIWKDYTEQADKTQNIVDELSVFLKSTNMIVEPTKNGFGLIKYPKDYGRYSSVRIIVYNDETIPDSSLDICGCDGEIKKCGANETEQEKSDREEAYKNGITEKSLYKIANSRWGSILDHRTKKPTLSNPAITQYEGGFKVAPRNLSVVILDYYIEPKYAIFVYTVSAGNTITGQGDSIVYNQQLSGKLEWNKTMIPEFVDRLCKVYGIYTRDPLIIQAIQK